MSPKDYLTRIEAKTTRTTDEEIALYLGTALEEVLSQLGTIKNKALDTRFLMHWGHSILENDLPTHP